MGKKLAARVCLVFCAALMLAGCSTVRAAREAQRGRNTSPGERTSRAAEMGLSSNTVLSLEQALELALKHNPSVFQASQNVASAVAQTTQARAGLLPSLGASASYSRGTQNTSGSSESSSSKSSYSGSLQLNLLLYDFGKTPAGVRQAVASQLAAEYQLWSARNDAVYAVRSAFYDLCKAQELRQVAEESLRQYKEHLEQVKAFLAVGKRTRYDVTKSEVDVGNAELSLINAINAVSDARAVLNNSLGLAEDPEYRVAPAKPIDFVPVLSNLVAEAMDAQPDICALRAREMAASAGVDVAVADLFPQLSLSGRDGGSGSSLPLTWNWSGTLGLSLNLFDGMATSAGIDRSVAALKIARSALAAREQQIFMQISRAVNQFESAGKRLALTELIVKQAAETLDIVNEQYRVGKASAVEVTDAQVALTSARANQVNAAYDYLTAVAQIHHYVGDEKYWRGK